MDRKKVIRKIVERDISNLSLSTTDIQTQLPMLYKVACEHFGDWPTALQYAGVSPHRAQKNHGQDKKSHVARCIRKRCFHKQTINAGAVCHADRKLYRAALKYFGSWKNALAAAGINAENVHTLKRRPRYTREQVVAKIKERHAQGLPIRYTDVALEDWDLFREGSDNSMLGKMFSSLLDLSQDQRLASLAKKGFANSFLSGLPK